MPPITAPGMVLMSAAIGPMNERRIEQTAAPPITQTLYTPVTAITPMFSP